MFAGQILFLRLIHLDFCRSILKLLHFPFISSSSHSKPWIFRSQLNFLPPNLMKVGLNASLPAEFLPLCIEGGVLLRLHLFTQYFQRLSCLYSFYSNALQIISINTGLLRCVITFIYWFSFHRTCFSSS